MNDDINAKLKTISSTFNFSRESSSILASCMVTNIRDLNKSVADFGTHQERRIGYLASAVEVLKAEVERLESADSLKLNPAFVLVPREQLEGLQQDLSSAYHRLDEISATSIRYSSLDDAVGELKDCQSDIDGGQSEVEDCQTIVSDMLGGSFSLEQAIQLTEGEPVVEDELDELVEDFRKDAVLVDSERDVPHYDMGR